MPKKVAESTKLLDARVASLVADEPVRKQFTAAVDNKAVNDEQRTVRFVITTGAVDRDNDTIDPAGWDCSEFLRSPSVLWAHDYSLLPVARALDITATGTGLESTAQFPPKGMHPFADTVFDLIKFGAINTCSVGFRPMEYTRDEERGGLNFKRQSLLEWSVVPVPANAQALVVARSKGANVEALKAWAKHVLDDLAEPIDADALRLKLASPEVAAVADKTVAPPNVEPPESLQACPACGATYDGRNCAECGWASPDGEPISAPVGASHGGGRVKLLRRIADPKHVAQSAAGVTSVIAPSDDPLRWNRSLSKAFDVDNEPLEASGVMIAWIARYIGVPVKDVSVESFVVPSARMGSFLSAYDEGICQFDVDTLRNINYSGKEIPPAYESIQLNSLTQRSFLVDGIRFMHGKADNVRMVSRMTPCWMGLEVTHYVRHEAAETRTKFVNGTWARAAQMNYLRGEAFTLSGEFLDRGDLDWPALFLEPQKEAVLRRVVDRINENGDEMDSRGLMLMGPPGTGKKLSGRVMMRQAETTFIWVSARDFYRSGAFGAFTYAFDIAAECAPSIIFFEDVDNWLGKDTIDLLKTEMDGLKRRKGIQTILTTNFPELLPEALIDRPGRFHDLLEMALPTEAVRARMLASWMPEASTPERAAAAKETDGYSGAHIRELATFARIIAMEDKLTPGAALVRALEKLREQRDLVADLHAPRDYRPRLQVRAAVRGAVAEVTKRGRVLSAVNEGKLRTAREHLDGVLSQLDAQPTPDEAAAIDDAVVLQLAADDVAVLRIDEDSDIVVRFDVDDFKTAVTTCVAESLGAIVRHETQAAFAKARGRVD